MCVITGIVILSDCGFGVNENMFHRLIFSCEMKQFIENIFNSFHRQEEIY
jgi:hypothetical protein